VELDIVGAALRPHGDPRARRAAAVIAAVADRLAPLPVVVRERGSGMDGADARALRDAGVAAVDVGGAGASRDPDGGGAGAKRALHGGAAHGNPHADGSGAAFATHGVPAGDAFATHGVPAGDAFATHGVPAGDAVTEAVLMAPGLPVIAGGPLRDGVEVAMCLALGARAACLSRPFADRSPEDAGAIAAALVHQLRVAVWATGAPAAGALHAGHLRDARVP
jgi:isopentenyl-diphosphate delta-isomerase